MLRDAICVWLQVGTLRGQSPGECNCVSPGACLQNDLKPKLQLGKGEKTEQTYAHANIYSCIFMVTIHLVWHSEIVTTFLAFYLFSVFYDFAIKHEFFSILHTFLKDISYIDFPRYKLKARLGFNLRIIRPN